MHGFLIIEKKKKSHSTYVLGQKREELVTVGFDSQFPKTLQEVLKPLRYLSALN